MVARTSPDAVTTLRTEVLDCIARCKTRKVEVLGKLLFTEPVNPTESDLSLLMHPRGCAPESAFKTSAEAFVRETRAKIEASLKPLFMPRGQVVHFVKSSEFKSGAYGRPGDARDSYAARKYSPVATTCDAFIDYLVSPTMLTDHMPDRYLHASLQ